MKREEDPELVVYAYARGPFDGDDIVIAKTRSLPVRHVPNEERDMDSEDLIDRVRETVEIDGKEVALSQVEKRLRKRVDAWLKVEFKGRESSVKYWDEETDQYLEENYIEDPYIIDFDEGRVVDEVLSMWPGGAR